MALLSHNFTPLSLWTSFSLIAKVTNNSNTVWSVCDQSLLMHKQTTETVRHEKS